MLVVLLDDVGFSDFGCYGSTIATPTIDALASRGLRYTGFHTTAMCSTTRAALLTGRNHHRVGVGCLANFDSGYPGYRGKIAAEAGTLAEMVRPHGYRTYMVGKWHVTPSVQQGPTGPFDGWPLARGFDRFYGFMDAETDQYSPEVVRDNTHVTPPGTYETGYHLTEDLADNALTYLADHRVGVPDQPWLLWFAPGACHAPHQVSKELIDRYDPQFAHGWDRERARRLARQIELGIVPPGTELPPLNDGVRAWEDMVPDAQRVAQRLQAAYAAMLDHTDQQLARVVGFLEASDQLDNTLILVMSDNGASQEGGPLGFINAMGPFNGIRESLADKLARLDDIGGPDTHTNFPTGWAMAANTPLKRYKQNTHGGGIRDPLVISWPGHITAAGELRHQFTHAVDVAPTILDLIRLAAPEELAGLRQLPIDGVSFAATLDDADATTGKVEQYFEMFGHRGLWQDGWKAVAYHPPGTPFEDDRWELYHLTEDFAEVHDLATEHPGRLADMVARWTEVAEDNQVLPLDDRFAERFAENAARHQGHRTRFEFWPGVGHIPAEVAPDVRSRSYAITADVIVGDRAQGVLIAHGDRTSGYSLYFDDGFLVHDLNIGGSHQVVRSEGRVASGQHEVAFTLDRTVDPATGTLSVDGQAVGTMETTDIFYLLVSWSGLDIGFDRGSTVGDYAAPHRFDGTLRRVVVTLETDQDLDAQGAAEVTMARE